MGGNGANTDLAIGIVTQLFILSMINERLASFVKLQMYDADNWFSKVFGLFSRKTAQRFILTSKSNDMESESIRERTILIINLSLGFFIALILKADILTLIGSGSSKIELGWSNYSCDLSKWVCWVNIFKIVLGCILTGSFISLGSKFWHDMLDLVISVSSLRGKINNPNSYTGRNADEIQEFVVTSDMDIANLSLEQNKDKYAKYVNHIGFGRNRDGFFCVYLHAKQGDENYKAISKLRLYTKLPQSGRVIEQPFEAVAFIDEKIKAMQTASEWDVKAGNTTGTVCCKVKNNNTGVEQLLTCSHVVHDDNGKLGKGLLSNPLPVKLFYPDDGEVSSICKYALRNEFYDVAVIDIPEDKKEHFQNIAGLEKNAPASLAAYYGKEMHILTRDNTEKSAYLIEEIKDAITISYKDGDAHMKWLLRIGSVPSINSGVSKSPTLPGDSGSLVYREEGTRRIPIAMIIAGSDNYSYAVPMLYNLSQTGTIIS